MKLKIQIGIAFLAGFGASTVFGEAPIVLLVLMVLLAAGAFVWKCLDLQVNWSQLQLRVRKQETSMPQASRNAFVLGVGHQASR